MDNPVEWSAPVADLNKLEKDSVKFVFELAEKRLKHILEVSDKTTNRAYTFLTTCVPLIAFLLAALFRHYFGSESDHMATFLLRLIWGASVVCISGVAILLSVINPRDMHQLGREPRSLFTDALLNNEDYQVERQYKLLLIVEIEDIQNRIDFMQTQSNSRVKRIKIAFSLIALCGVAAFTVLLFLVLFP